MSDLARLCKPFADRLVHSNPSGGGSYVAHDVVVQKLLMVVGPFDFELVQIVRGDVPAVPPNPNGNSQRAKNGTPALSDCVVGAVCRLTVVVDGIKTRIEEVGDCESPSNWPHDGARMKDAMSDAIKRCAMRLGVGLHLWAQKDFIIQDEYIDAAIARRNGAPSGASASDGPDTGPGGAASTGTSEAPKVGGRQSKPSGPGLT